MTCIFRNTSRSTVCPGNARISKFMMQVSQAAIAELIREADLLGCLRHPNVVWVYGVVLPNPKEDSASSSDDDSDDSSEMARIPSSAAQQQGKGNVPGIVRPPAIVTEFMSQGSLKGALQRKADIVQGPLMRVLIAMDAAKVCMRYISPLP